MARLTQEALNFIKAKGNGSLYGEIADEIGVTTARLKDILAANTDERLASEGVKSLIKNHLAEMQDMQIIACVQEAA